MVAEQEPVVAAAAAAVPRVGLKMRLRVSPAAAAVLDHQSRLHGFLYNQLVALTLELRDQRDEADVRALLYSQYGLRNLLPGLKEQHPFLRETWSYSLQCTAMRVTETLKQHRRSRAGERGRPTEWPRLHRWSSHWASLEYHVLTGGMTVSGRTLTVRFGKAAATRGVDLELVQPLPDFARAEDALRGVRIVREHGVYYAVFTVARPLPAPKPIPAAPRVIALDPHHYNLVVGVDTAGLATRVAYPRQTRAYDRRLDQLKARRDTCLRIKMTNAQGIPYWVPSRRWAAFNALIQATQRRRDAAIDQALYSLANRLYREYDVVAVGNYEPASTPGVPTALNRWTYNNSLVGRLRRVLAWMARRSGKTFLLWEEAGTTRTCHACGFVWPTGIPTRLRYYRCPQCGHQWRRNENNAANGLDAALTQLGLPARPAAVATRRVWRLTPAGVMETAGMPVRAPP